MKEKNNAEDTSKIVEEFLEAYRNPTFGALPKAQIDAFVVRILKSRGKVEDNTWDLQTKLRISSAKATSIIYNMGLQTMGDIDDIDKKLENFLKNPSYEKYEKDIYFLLDVENPLIIDRIKGILRGKNAISDRSFSPSLIKLSLKAFIILVDYYGDSEALKEIKNKLKKELKCLNYEDSVLLTAVKAVANHTIGENGEKLVDRFLKSFLVNKEDFIAEIKEKIPFLSTNNNRR
jgi:hypothetical protein